MNFKGGKKNSTQQRIGLFEIYEILHLSHPVSVLDNHWFSVSILFVTTFFLGMGQVLLIMIITMSFVVFSAALK